MRFKTFIVEAKKLKPRYVKNERNLKTIQVPADDPDASKLDAHFIPHNIELDN